jgi:hypothetical protein
MLGATAAGHPGNGGSRWPALAEQAKRQTRELNRLAQYLEPDSDASQTQLGRLAEVDATLERVQLLVEDVRGHIRSGMPESDLIGPLDVLSHSMRATRDAIDDLAYIARREVSKVEDEKLSHRHRLHEDALADRRALRGQRRAAVKCLAELGEHMKRLSERLDVH